jgi:AcrR family transcriptional regulator
MGRPREHDHRTAATLLTAAERAIRGAGLEALSVRGIAEQAQTTTRAVYSLFGSKDGLVAALAAHGFELLGAAIKELPTTEDPIADLVAAGLAFRTFALEHPTLFAIAIQRPTSDSGPWLQVRAASNDALAGLLDRLDRLGDAIGLGGRTVHGAACQFHALCEGLASLELRGVQVGDHHPGDAQKTWEEALAALATGFAAPVSEPAKTRRLRRERRQRD